MDTKEPLYADVLTQEELEVLRAREENDRTIMPLAISQVNPFPIMPHAPSHENIPLRHFRQQNACPVHRPVGVNLSVPPTIMPTPRFSGVMGYNQSFSSAIQGEVEMQYFFDEPCLGAEGGYDPFLNRTRKTTSGCNGLPRSTSVRQGIDRRFLRNKAPCNTGNGHIGQDLQRCNTVACIRDMPLLASTRCKAEVESFHSNSSKRNSCENVIGAPSGFGEGLYDNLQVMNETSQTLDVALRLTDDENEVLDGSQSKESCQSCFFFSLIAFAASLSGAALYSLITCSIAGCR